MQTTESGMTPFRTIMDTPKKTRRKTVSATTVNMPERRDKGRMLLAS